MNAAPWWNRFACARLRLDLLLQAGATALLARVEQPGIGQEADRLSTALEATAQVAREVLSRVGR